ncbi:hypothetical protein [Anabaena sp. CCY 9402-a]
MPNAEPTAPSRSRSLCLRHAPRWRSLSERTERMQRSAMTHDS